MKTGSLFSGYGGLDLAVAEFFGAEPVWHSEIDPGACQILAHHWPAVPNLGDITRIDWAQVEPVDILTGGWPCQPFSLAGKRKGALDERALWPYVAGAVRALRPRHVLLENVAAIATAGELARAVADLAAIGYVGSWRCVRAADVGAPHGRARIFILAVNTASVHAGLALSRGRGQAESITLSRPLHAGSHAATDTQRGGRDGRAGQLGPGRRAEPAHSSGGTPADAEGNGWHEGRPEPARLLGGPDAPQRSHAPTHTNGHGLQGVRRLQPIGRDLDGRGSADTAWGAYEPAVRRWERVLGRRAPSPTETSRNGGQRLSPAFVEWMMGLPAGHVTAVPGLGRNAQLKALGNGVVPQQAFEALRRMWPEAVAA